MYKFSGLAEQLAQLRQRIPAHVSGKVPAHVILNKREKNVFQQGLGSISYKTMRLNILSGLKPLKYKALRNAGANTAFSILSISKIVLNTFLIYQIFFAAKTPAKPYISSSPGICIPAFPRHEKLS